MIYDQKFLSDSSHQWKAIRKFRSGSHRQRWVSGTLALETPPSEFYNLSFLLAYALLDQVLAELINQGTFQCAGRALLGEKMEASKNVLPWQDYDKITNGRNDRNDLAHEAKLLNKDKCF